ncbi:MSHA biogenesis protein MshJ [Sulfuricaulis limicola]|uniref:MSHA biogenesis protein MshJ n=1 Tax=Sulfuricaulis limicola TaxID=1620215 RepID=A0A1B4XD52_9GAMM|nr:type II secretion system protein M [Sulfuricaulis limicola]BAV32715.1 MSHA biogenesis protein MshJ [Sulfuricaulis limicola]
MTADDLKKQFQGFANRVDAMSLRERAMIFITLLVALYFLAVNVLFGPLSAEKDRVQQQLTQKRLETQALEAQIQTMAGSGTEGVDAAKRNKLETLRENLKTMDTELVRVTAGLVPPREMARLIEQMLLKNRGLQVMRVESIPATPLLEGGAGVTGAMVYKHGMRVEVKGGYLDILRYLKSLEALPWKVFWGKAALKTEKYPDSRVSLVIYTLSTHEAWIGL